MLELNETLSIEDFRAQIEEGIPSVLPAIQAIDSSVSHAPRRKDILSKAEKELALRNSLRYFPKEQTRRIGA